MTGIRTIAASTLALLLISFAGFSIAVASEVTGTLSSDGEAGTQHGGALSNSTGQAVTHSDGQIRGSVTGGREEHPAFAFLDYDPWNAAAWAAPLAAAMVAVLAYLLWRRRTT